jgi:hypothetical protein
VDHRIDEIILYISGTGAIVLNGEVIGKLLEKERSLEKEFEYRSRVYGNQDKEHKLT